VRKRGRRCFAGLRIARKQPEPFGLVSNFAPLLAHREKPARFRLSGWVDAFSLP
jgi:hypothetical protein